MFASFSEIHWEATRVVTEGPNAALEFQVEATNSAPILSPAGMIPATGKRITLQGVSLFKLNERARSLRSGGTSTPAASSPARAWRVDGCQARPKFLSGAVQAVETITLHLLAVLSGGLHLRRISLSPTVGGCIVPTSLWLAAVPMSLRPMHHLAAENRSGRRDVDLETMPQLEDGYLLPRGHVAAGRRRRRQERKHEHPICLGLGDTFGLMLRRPRSLGIAAEIKSQRARRAGDNQTRSLDERLEGSRRLNLS
jgi:hypothetical protein